MVVVVRVILRRLRGSLLPTTSPRFRSTRRPSFRRTEKSIRRALFIIILILIVRKKS